MPTPAESPLEGYRDYLLLLARTRGRTHGFAARAYASNSNEPSH